MKKFRIISRILMFFVLLGCVVVELYLHGAFQFVEKLDTVYSMQELTAYMNEQLQKEQTEFKVYTEGISQEEIENCNRTLDGFLGTVDTYVILGERKKNTKKVRFTLNFSDNLYTWNALMNGWDIHSAPEKAQELYSKVQQILSETVTSEMSDFEKEKALHDYLAKHCAYGEISGEEEEESYKAYGVLNLGQGVCNGYAEAMYLLLNASGVECKMVVGTANGEDHAWNLVCLDGQWYHLDATWDDPTPDQENYVQYHYFNLTDELMRNSHSWQEEDYPACTEDTYNYYVYYNKICGDYETFVAKVNNQIEKKKANISFLVADYSEANYNMSFILDQHTSVTKASYSVAQTDLGNIITIKVNY